MRTGGTSRVSCIASDGEGSEGEGILRQVVRVRMEFMLWVERDGVVCPALDIHALHEFEDKGAYTNLPNEIQFSTYCPMDAAE